MYYHIKNVQKKMITKRVHNPCELGKIKKDEKQNRKKIKTSTKVFYALAIIFLGGLFVGMLNGWYLLLFNQIGSINLIIWGTFILIILFISWVSSLSVKMLSIIICSFLILMISIYSSIHFTKPIYYPSINHKYTIIQMNGSFYKKINTILLKKLNISIPIILTSCEGYWDSKNIFVVKYQVIKGQTEIIYYNVE